MSTEPVRRIAIVDDEAPVRRALRELLEIENYVVLEFSDGEVALTHIGAEFEGIVIADLRMPGLDGATLFARLARQDPDLPVIMISGHGDVTTAVDLVRRGAYDFLSKPFDADQLMATVRRAMDARALALENRALRQPQPSIASSALLGESRVIERLRQTIDQLVHADVDVLLSGASGTGKSLIASILHRRSPRSRKPMVTVDCRALPGEQAESLLFGHVSGAFPAAQFPQTGQLLHASAGTLFLDHVEGLPGALQTRMQQALESGTILPVGASQPQATRFRSISSTSSDIDRLVQSGEFLSSLYFRLGSFRLTIPPLRERGDDAIVLFRRFLIEESQKLGRDAPELTAAVWRRLKEHDWPGNIRELRSFATNVALGLTNDLAQQARPGTLKGEGGLKLSVARFEAESIRNALERNRGDVSATIADLELPRKTFYDKLHRHGIAPDDYRIHRYTSR